MFHTHHEPIFVLLSVVVAVFGSWTALDLFRRVRAHIATARRVWLGAAAVCMGLSIWSMHFIAMLGFDPGSPVNYDPTLTLASLTLAIGATCAAFAMAAREGAAMRQVLLAGGAMGVGICLMHYTGMAALRTAVSLGYTPWLVLLSLAVAVGASIAALLASRREGSFRWRLGVAVILGMAVVGMHFTAMAALRIAPAPGATEILAGAPPLLLGGGVAAGTLVILVLALLASVYDQRLSVISALEAGEVGYWELSVPDNTLYVSPRAKHILGWPVDQPFGRKDLENLLTPEDRVRRESVMRRALEAGETYDAEYLLQMPDTTERWVNIRGRVVSYARRRPRRMAGVVLDVTDRREAYTALEKADGRQRFLINELNHRVKNNLATVQSIARQTAKRSGSLDVFTAAFEARLVALSKAHDLLTRGGWLGASFNDLLQMVLGPYPGDQVALQGPQVELPTPTVPTLAMILYELATNAAKYGALSTASGRVSVTWRTIASPKEILLDLEWVETGGPPVRLEKRGFGSLLVERSIRDLGGRGELLFDPEGVRCRLIMPAIDPDRSKTSAPSGARAAVANH